MTIRRAVGLSLLSLPWLAMTVGLGLTGGWLLAAVVPGAFAIVAVLYLGFRLALED